ncbi:MAG TPA: GrdX protein [Clostridiales bacterium]|nr:GrdX protein [Clostridiales bacterium]
MIITNNDMVYNKYKDEYCVEFYDCSIKEVMIKVRDRIHEGYKMLTHPLSSSIKPNESLYKSIMISDDKTVLDYNSLLIIENGIITCDKFNKIKYNIVYTDRIIEDFKLIDLTVLESALNRV